MYYIVIRSMIKWKGMGMLWLLLKNVENCLLLLKIKKDCKSQWVCTSNNAKMKREEEELVPGRKNNRL